MVNVTHVVYKDGDQRYKASYVTKEPSVAMRRFFAERGDAIWQAPVRVYTERRKTWRLK